MKKILSILLAVLMLTGIVPASVFQALAADFTVSAMFKPDPQATPDTWTQSGTTAESLAGRTFFIDMTVTNNSGLAQSKTFTLTGENLETFVISNFNGTDGNPIYDTPVLLFTRDPDSDNPIHYYGTLSKTVDGSGKITALSIGIAAGANAEGSAAVQQLTLAVSFKQHSNGGSVTLSDTTPGTINTVTEKVIAPTLSATNTVSPATFYQWLANGPSGGYQTFTSTTTPKTNSSSNTAIPYLGTVTVKQTVTFNRFALTSDPAVTNVAAGDTVEYLHNSAGQCIGYTVTATRTGNGTEEVALPTITSKVAIYKNKMVPGTGSSDQSVIVSSTVEGTPANGTETVGPAVGADKLAREQIREFHLDDRRRNHLQSFA